MTRRKPEHFHITKLKRTYNRKTDTFTINISYETAPTTLTERTKTVAEAFGLGTDQTQHFTLYDHTTIKIHPTDIVLITGDSVFVKKGTYEEHSILINKSIILAGEDKTTTVIKNNGATISTVNATINIASNDVKITGFTITDSVRGIDGKGDRTQIIDNIIIAEQGVTLEGYNQTIAQNILKSPDNIATILSPGGTIYGNGYGILCFGSYNNISANEFTGPRLESIMLRGQEGSFNLVYGNTVKDSGFMKVFGNRNIIVSNNMTGPTVGIWIYTGSNNVVCANRITDAGISISSGYENTIYANHIKNCRSGVSIERLQTYIDYGEGPWIMNNTFYNNNFVNNDIQVSGGDTNLWDNGKEGNYWSDYTGVDADGDGIGDTPYVIDATTQDNFPLMAPFDIDSVAVQLQAWASSVFLGKHSIAVLSPQNTTYTTSDVPLNFTLPESAPNIRYSLDGQNNITTTGNTTLTALANGAHNLTLYADDPFGNTTTSETTHFTVAEESEVELFQTTSVVAAAIATAAVVSAGLIVYFKKRKH
jgi:nitrous oxidase accessory protein NosD